MPAEVAETIRCYAYPKLSAEEKGENKNPLVRIERWFRGTRREEDGIGWGMGDGEVDFADRFGKWFLQGREIEGWECRDW